MLGIDTIANSIKDLFTNKLRKPANLVPGIIMLCSLVKRPGLSCIISVGNIIQELENNGIPTGPLPDGTPNLMNKMIRSIVCETIRSLKEDANIQITVPPGFINIVASGGNAGGPVTVVGSNINCPKGVGLIQ